MIENWGLLEADMHEVYGIDVSEPGVLSGHSGRWLSRRIAGLLSTEESRLRRTLFPPQEVKP